MRRNSLTRMRPRTWRTRRHEPALRIDDELRIDERIFAPDLEVASPAARTFFTHWTSDP